MKKYIASVEVPDDWEPKYKPYSVDFFFDRDIISTDMVEDESTAGDRFRSARRAKHD